MNAVLEATKSVRQQGRLMSAPMVYDLNLTLGTGTKPYGNEANIWIAFSSQYISHFTLLETCEWNRPSICEHLIKYGSRKWAS